MILREVLALVVFVYPHETAWDLKVTAKKHTAAGYAREIIRLIPPSGTQAFVIAHVAPSMTYHLITFRRR